jgi:Mrp family chromosome partitioning ATPase
VLVLEANSTRRVAARKAKQALEASSVRVLGTVLNNRTFPIPEKIYRML